MSADQVAEIPRVSAAKKRKRDPLVVILRRLDAIEARLAPPDLWLDAKQAAAYLGVGPRRIYAGVRIGTLKHVVVDRRGTIRTKKQWCDDFMQAKAAA